MRSRFISFGIEYDLVDMSAVKIKDLCHQEACSPA